MSANHLLSASLFAELFQHNLVSPDGRIIANDRQLRDYSTFLIKQSKDRVASLYAERKNLVDDVEELLRLDFRTDEEEELLKKLVNELDLKFDEEGIFLEMKEPRKPPKRYLGPKEPNKSIFEKKIEDELERVKTLKRDLRKLDDWLLEIAHFRRTADQEEHVIDWKEAALKYRERTANRMCDMEKARMKLIKQHYKDYDKTLNTLLNRTFPKERYLTRLPPSERTDAKAKDEDDTGDKSGATEAHDETGNKHDVYETRVNVEKDDAEKKGVKPKEEDNTGVKSGTTEAYDDTDNKHDVNETQVNVEKDDVEEEGVAIETASAVIATGDADKKEEEEIAKSNTDGESVASDA